MRYKLPVSACFSLLLSVFVSFCQLFVSVLFGIFLVLGLLPERDSVYPVWGIFIALVILIFFSEFVHVFLFFSSYFDFFRDFVNLRFAVFVCSLFSKISQGKKCEKCFSPGVGWRAEVQWLPVSLSSKVLPLLASHSSKLSHQ